MGLRMLIFAAFLDPYFGGGSARNIYELSKRLVEQGYEIDVITCNTNKEPAEEEAGGVHIHRLPSWNILHGTYPIPKPTVTTIKILWKLLMKRFDLINTQTRFFSTSLLGLTFAKIKRKPLVHTERGSRHSVLENKLIDKLSELYDHTIGALIARSAIRSVGISEAACEFLKHLGAKNPVIIPNGIDADVFKKVKTDLAKTLGLDDALIITFVGRLIYAKGVQDLISAFPMVEEIVHSVKLLIVGEGPYRSQLEQQAANTSCRKNIKFLGQKNREQIIEILNVTDVFINPSYSEGLPTTILEAAAIGVPIVATDTGGTREIIEHGKTGLLIEAGEPRQIVEAISLLAEKKQTAQEDVATKFGEAARVKAIKNYSWENVVNKAMQVYQEILVTQK